MHHSSKVMQYVEEFKIMNFFKKNETKYAAWE